MELKQLIKRLSVKQVIGDCAVDIKDIKTDSNSVTKDSLFVCLKGGDKDGHDYIRQAEKYGAVAVVCEKEIDTALPQIIVDNTRLALSLLACEFYGRVSDKMRLIGIVGTNGKTTTSHLIANVLNRAGIKCGIIGTLGAFLGDKSIPTDLTTPDPLILNKILKEMYDAGYLTVVMEVSAHAIHFQKVGGLKFEVGVLTNFSRDHLDFFGDMESYKNTKAKFFGEEICKFCVVNSDDDLGQKLAREKQVITYGIENPSDVFAIELENVDNGQNFVVNLFDCIYDVHLKMHGKFNVYNALATATTCCLLGVSPQKTINGINKTTGVDGRLQCVYKGAYSLYIDYAHTPDGLYNILTAVRGFSKKRVICVFGCGGNRDSGKRVQMGEISAKYADFTIVTSDNPRYEEPMEIIYEIEKGVLKNSKNYVLIQDRKDAIEYAIMSAKKGDVIVIAGKGSENYQEILGIKRPYNDKDTVEEILRSIKK